MLLPRLLTATTLLGAATALKNASPFFMLSSEHIKDTDLHSDQIGLASELQFRLFDLFGECPARHYIFMHQDGISAATLQHADAMPHISKRVLGHENGFNAQIPNVLGRIDTLELQKRLSDSCGYDHTQVSFEGLQEDFAAEQLVKDFEAKKESWLLIFTSSPAVAGEEYDERIYEMDDPYPSSLHQDLKRATPETARKVARADDNNDWPNEDLGLFEKYQYLTPGIFMGILTMLLLLVIAYTGVSAIAGMQVSYMAFSKEMGPSAQKPKQ